MTNILVWGKLVLFFAGDDMMVKRITDKIFLLSVSFLKSDWTAQPGFRNPMCELILRAIVLTLKNLS